MPHLIILDCLLAQLAILQNQLTEQHDFLESDVERDARYQQVQQLFADVSAFGSEQCEVVKAFVARHKNLFPSNPQGED